MNFGTTHLADRGELEDPSGPKWATLLTGIMEHLVRLERALLIIKVEMAALEAAGMWPAVPTEIWEPRPNTTHGERRYLKLSFPMGALDKGRRKLYVGCKPERITEARQKADRRRRWEALEKERTRLERFLRMTRSSVGGVAGSVQRYQIPFDDLGLERDVAEASAGPKELPRESAPEWVRTRVPVEYEVEKEPEGRLPFYWEQEEE